MFKNREIEKIFESNFDALIQGSYDDLSISPNADSIIKELAIQFCNTHDISLSESFSLFKSCFSKWSDTVINSYDRSIW